MVSANAFNKTSYLNVKTALELNLTGIILTVSKIEPHIINDEPKLICSFLQTDSTLVLNKTNVKTMIDMFGEETDLWVNKGITINVTETDFNDTSVKGLRIV